jgi:hypothetical protein
MGRPLGDTRRGHALRAERCTVHVARPAARPRPRVRDTTGRGGELFRSPGHVEPVTCLFSLIARCGRGAFQLSVLVSQGVSSRGARLDTPVPGAIQTAGGIKREGLSRKRVPSLGPLRCTRFNSSRPETHSRASTANPSMTIMKHNPNDHHGLSLEP